MDAPNKTKKKQMIIAFGGIAGFILLMVVGMWFSDPNRGKPTPMDIQRQKAKEVHKKFTAGSSKSVSASETWISLSEQRLTRLQGENKSLRERLEQLEIRLNNGEGRNGRGTQNGTPVRTKNPILPGTSLPPPPKPKVVNNLPNPLTQAVNPLLNQQQRLPPPPAQGKLPARATAPGGQGNTIEVISLSNNNNTSGKNSTKNVSHYLPTGSFATAILLSGMDAPTGGQSKSNPVPVLLRIMDSGQLPNYFNSDVDNCHATGAAFGDISSERAHIRLEVLTCVLVNGDIIEEPIKGYVAGEDGKAGMRGRLVSKQGSLLAKSLLAGIAGGVGSAINQQYQRVSTSALGQVSSIDPSKIGEAGLATGTANSMERLADYYIARADEIYPIIEVDANRIGEVILTGGTDLKKNLIGNTRERNQ